MDLCLVAHRPLELILSLEALSEPEEVEGVEEVITMNITELPDGVAPLTRAGVVEHNHLRHYLHKFLFWLDEYIAPSNLSIARISR
jgi:hypothetical protein